MIPAETPLLKDARFRPLFVTQFLGALNDNFLKNALVVLVEYQGLSMLGLEPSMIVALAGGIFILPFFLFSMVAGQLADQFEKSRIVRLVKVWELLITLVAAVGFFQLNIYLLLGALFMMGTHSAFFGPIKYGCLPDLVSPARLISANAYVELGTFVAILLGTIGGGLLIAMDQGPLWIAIALNVCAVLGIWSSFGMPHLPPHSARFAISINPFGPMRATLTMIARQKDVFNSLLGISWFWFFGAALLSLLPPYCKEFLHTDEHVITAFLTMFTLGIGLGSMLCSRLSMQKTVLGLVPVGALGMSVFLLDLCWVRFQAVPVSVQGTSELMRFSEFWATDYGPRLLFDFLMLSVFGGLFILPLYTAMQERSDQKERSRVVAGNNVMNAVFMVVASVFVMLAHAYGFTVTQAFLALAVLNILAMLYLYWQVPEFGNLREWYKEWKLAK